MRDVEADIELKVMGDCNTAGDDVKTRKEEHPAQTVNSEMLYPVYSCPPYPIVFFYAMQVRI